MIRLLPLLLVMLLAACGGGTRPASAGNAAPYVPIPAAGQQQAGGGGNAALDRLMGQPAKALVGALGQPALTLNEGAARKLQFRSTACVLDAYFYPKKDKPRDRPDSEPVLTHVDARRPDGVAADKASCLAAISAGRRR